jgi:peptidoglycan-associated lipoprotein
MSKALLVISISLSLFLGGCSCRTKPVTDADSNLPVAQADGDLRDINYAFDSYELDFKARSVLNANAEWMKSNPNARVMVEGHCDERGTNEYNMVLGSNRARAAHEYLRSLGIDASRLSTVSYGEELPLDPRHTEEAWSKNRRAHFSVQR